jgi:hypothetical protein
MNRNKIIMQLQEPKNKHSLHISWTKCPSNLVLIESERQYHVSSDCVKLVGGGNETPMFTTTDRTLTHHEAADILVQNIRESVTNEPPYRPKPGSVFLYDDSGDINGKD